MKILRKTMPLLFAVLLFASCSKDAALTEEPSFGGEKKGFALCFSTADMDLNTLSTRAEANVETDITSGLILQFGGTIDSAPLIFTQKFTETLETKDSNEKKVYVDFEDPDRTTVYVVVNVADAESKLNAHVGTTTLGDFKKQVLGVTAESDFQNTLPMVGVAGKFENDSATVQLTRLVSKFDFTCKVEIPIKAEEFKIEKVQVTNIAKSVGVVSADAVSYADGLDCDYFFDYDAVTVEPASDAEFKHVWYVPENLRGVVASIGENPKKKGGAAVPAHSTCIEVSGKYTKDGKAHDVTYNIYPGANTTTDFNVTRNTAYKISVTIKGMAVSDVRIEKHESGTDKFPYYGSANCILADKDGNATIDVTPRFTEEGTYFAYNTTVWKDVPDDKTPKKAKVIWYETALGEPTIANGGAVKNNEVHVKLPADKYGNALIGIYGTDESTPLWSFHVWKPNWDPTAEDALLVYDNTWSGNSFKVMPLALGATVIVKSGNATPESAGLYYQWGRKDPLGRPSALAANTSTMLATTGTAFTAATRSSMGGEGKAAIKYTIEHPTVFFYDSGEPYDWYTGTNNNASQNNNLWGASSPDETQDYHKRTIFDPCPAGYRVAPKGLWRNFTNTGQTVSSTGGIQASNNTTMATQIGYHFYYNAAKSATDFYPASGYRARNSGALTDVGAGGFSWSSSPTSESVNAGILLFNASSVSPLNNYRRASGFPVRCVQE